MGKSGIIRVVDDLVWRLNRRLHRNHAGAGPEVYDEVRLLAHQTERRAQRAVQYLCATALVMVAFYGTLHVPSIDTQPFFTFFTAVVAVSAYVLGWRAGLLSTVLSSALVAYFTIRPVGSFSISEREDLTRFLLFLLTAVLICSLSAGLSASKQASKRAVADRQVLELAQRAARVWVWEYDSRSHHVNWRDIYADGQQATSHTFQRWLDRIHPEDRERVAHAVGAAFQGGRLEISYRFAARWPSAGYELLLSRAVPVAPERLIGITIEMEPVGGFTGSAAAAASARAGIAATPSQAPAPSDAL